MLNLVRSYPNAASVPAGFISDPGKVHNASYTSLSLGLTFPAETLLFLPNPVSQTSTTAGNTGYNYAVKFAYKPQGWNKFYRPNSNSYENIYNLAGVIVEPYPPANLAALLA